jgi:hypothetical protein
MPRSVFDDDNFESVNRKGVGYALGTAGLPEIPVFEI